MTVSPLAIPDCGAVDVPAAEQRQPTVTEAALYRTARRGRQGCINPPGEENKPMI
jgi:hypothetical protein